MTIRALGNIAKVFAVEVTFNPASVAAATTAEQTVSVPGVKVGDIVTAVKPTLTAGVTIGNVRASAADTVAIQFVNATAGAVDPGSESWKFLIFRPEPATLPASFAG